MKNELNNFREIVEACYRDGYRITDENVIIDEDSVGGFEIDDYIVLTYKRATKEGFSDCLEVLRKDGGKEKLSEGRILSSYSNVVTACLKYNIDIAENLREVDKGSVRGFESMAYIIVTYKRLEGDHTGNYISFFEKVEGVGEFNLKGARGRDLQTAKNIVEVCSKNNIDITADRLFLEAYSAK